MIPEKGKYHFNRKKKNITYYFRFVDILRTSIYHAHQMHYQFCWFTNNYCFNIAIFSDLGDIINMFASIYLVRPGYLHSRKTVINSRKRKNAMYHTCTFILIKDEVLTIYIFNAARFWKRQCHIVVDSCFSELNTI